MIHRELPGPGTGAAWAARESLREGRVTILLLGGEGDDDATDAWLAHGVEVAAPDDPAEWLATRRFHFAAVMADEAASATLDVALAATQPQAARSTMRDCADLAGAEVSATLLLDLGLVPSGRPG